MKSLNEQVENALRDIGVPVRNNWTADNGDEWLYWNTELDTATLSADDEPVEDTATVMVHYIVPAYRDYVDRKKQIRKALKAATDAWPQVQELTESEGKIKHFVFEVDFSNNYELEGE